MVRLIVLIAALLALGTESIVVAHPGHLPRQNDNDRVWTLRDGPILVRGSFVTLKVGQVQIRRRDGSLESVQISQLVDADQAWIAQRMNRILLGNDQLSLPLLADVSEDRNLNLQAAQELPMLLAQADTDRGRDTRSPEIAAAFAAFVKTKAIRTRWDDQFFYVESRGIPDHQMMVGITAWQQQVPIPQAYLGDNAWRIPLNPVPAKSPQSAKGNFLRGAIALAANGVPIFNPLNNRGDDAFLFGELDEFGGHCGRADDYHYHIAPVHLEKTVGRGLPIAYALDGYPIYGYDEPDGSKVTGLDAFNGHKDARGNYHYHATKTYPYLNGGFYGEVTERGGQVEPQPRANPLRPDLRPLRGAKIIDFQETKPNSYELTYSVNGRKGSVRYTLSDDGSARFVFVDTDGKSTTENYTPRRRGPAGPGPGSEDRPPPPPRRGEGPPPPRGDRPSRDGQPRPGEGRPDGPRTDTATRAKSNLPQLTVTSPAFQPGGTIPVEFTGDGASASPPVEWAGAPQGTKSYAVNVWHVPGPGDIKSYWVVYNIPANITKLARNEMRAGTIGVNDKNRREYDPMKSKGPGVKQYHITVYALSSDVKLTPEKASRANLLDAIKEITLAEGTLDFQYERKR
ncbi:MAG: YHYH protein [Planctomycetes bacterium]|nr:YHYH protein [Planctomycetota bacterium]